MSLSVITFQRNGGVIAALAKGSMEGVFAACIFPAPDRFVELVSAIPDRVSQGGET